MRWENISKRLFVLLLLVSACSVSKEEQQEKIVKKKVNETIEIEVLVEEDSMIVSLENNKTTQCLLERLPLEARMSDFASAEKIVYLDDNLEETTTKGYDPQIYDFAYYAPWHNLVFFYEDQPYDDGLIYLGKIVTQQDVIKTIAEDSVVVLQKKE